MLKILCPDDAFFQHDKLACFTLAATYQEKLIMVIWSSFLTKNSTAIASLFFLLPGIDVNLPAV
jgi:hypothetical protein